MEYYFCLVFRTYFFIIFTYSKRLFISLHFAKQKRMKIEYVRAELQLANLRGNQNQNSISWKLKCLNCIGLKKV